jgi:uncharacterized protein (TIGR03435 family)
MRKPFKYVATFCLTMAVGAHFTSEAWTQTAPQRSAGPTYDVVSVKRNMSTALGSDVIRRPDGGFSITNVPVSSVIPLAYPEMFEISGLPDWTKTERYDIRTTSTLTTATADQRIAMLRALLADRFKLLVHVDKVESHTYNLVVARRDGRLGPGLERTDNDCERIRAERRAAGISAAPLRPDFAQPPPACSVRVINPFVRDRSGDKQGALGDLLEGESTMADFAMMLTPWAGRTVVDKTGLSGAYRIRMNFDSMALRRPPDPNAPTVDGPPSVLVALPEQLGLRLEAADGLVATLVVDRIERPTEDP